MAPGTGLDTEDDAGNDEQGDNGKTDDDNLLVIATNSPSELDEELSHSPFCRWKNTLPIQLDVWSRFAYALPREPRPIQLSRIVSAETIQLRSSKLYNSCIRSGFNF